MVDEIAALTAYLPDRELRQRIASSLGVLLSQGRAVGVHLVDLDVHPRVVMQVLRHAKFSITMEIYSQVTSAQTRDALKRLGDSLDE